MRHQRWTRLSVAVVGMVALSAYGLLGAQAAPNEFRPFEGTFEATNQTTDPSFASSPVVTFDAQGTFQADHMGRGTYEAQGLIDYQRHPQVDHFECGFVVGSLVLTAANGDSLSGNIDPDRSVYCQSQPGDPVEVTLYVEVSFGTGRFAHAHGWYFVKSTLTPQAAGPSAMPIPELGYILGSIEY